MCTYSGHVKTITVAQKNGYGYEFGVSREIPKGIKRIRATCPECKRRIVTSINICHDGCCIIHSIPKHKRKGWWK